MERLKRGLSLFLTETSLHGFKYLGPNHGCLSKILWTLILTIFIGYAAISVNNAITDWNDRPVITSVETIDAPVNEIQFPTITFCHEDYFQPDNWALTEIVFNNFELRCPDEKYNEHGCEQTMKLREDFEPFFKLIFEEIGKLIDQANFDEDSLKGKELELYRIMLSLHQNKTNLNKLEKAAQKNRKFCIVQAYDRKLCPFA